MDPVATVLTVWAVGLYAVGVMTLRQRGDRWPVGRSIAWGVGWLAFYLATSSGFATYDLTLLSVHMAQHMVLSMVVPLSLALGAPVTLALRTLPRTPRRWVLAVVHSRVVKVLSFPPLAFGLYVLAAQFCQNNCLVNGPPAPRGVGAVPPSPIDPLDLTLGDFLVPAVLGAA